MSEPPLSSLVGSMPGLRAQLAAEREAELREEGFVPVAEVDRLRADLAECRRRLKTIYDLLEVRLIRAALSAGDTTGGNDE